MSFRFFAIVLFVMVTTLCQAQVATTMVKGKVRDAATGEALPFVHVYFDGTQIGTTTDIDGLYKLQNDKGHTTVIYKMVGYRQCVKSVKYGTNSTINVSLTPSSTNLQAVKITAQQGRKERYRRRNNPAVDLARNVIANKGQNRIESAGHYSRQQYRKLTLTVEGINPDFDNSRFWRKFPFMEQYFDYSEPTVPRIGVSLREFLESNYYCANPGRRSSSVRAKRSKGVDKILDREGLSDQLDEMFQPADIYDGDIDVMLNHFVGPLSSAAITFYKYHIIDTVELDGMKCAQLSFVPVNKESYGFVGYVYVALDSSYAVKQYQLMVSSHINLNFVSDLNIQGSFSRDSLGRYYPTEASVEAKLSLHPRMKQILVRNRVYYSNYDLSNGVESVSPPDTTRLTDAQWDSLRPAPLTNKEVISQEVLTELKRIPAIRTGITIGSMISGGYFSTHRDSDSSLFDIGPLYNMVSYNTTEGLRLRCGGMTTTQVMPHTFASGYLAYGTLDQRIKGSLSLIHTFHDVDLHPFEQPMSFLSLTGQYDLENMGGANSLYERDNILMSSFTYLPMQYVGALQLRFCHEWENHLSFDTRVGLRNAAPAPGLEYFRIMDEGTTEQVDRVSDVQWEACLRFSPVEHKSKNRLGSSSPLNIVHDALSASITHKMGYQFDGFYYNSTEALAEKRFWLSSFGHIDLSVGTGIVWNRVPLPKLFLPGASTSIFMSPHNFNMVRPMEFAMDQYAELFATYYLKGWILNRIPLVKRLHLREVVSFSILAGGLSPRNNPAYGHKGLYELPAGCSPLGKQPYMECSMGLENIFRFVRIDYVRRLSYLEGLPANRKGCLRVGFRFAL